MRLDMPGYMQKLIPFARRRFAQDLAADEKLKTHLPEGFMPDTELWTLKPLDLGVADKNKTVGYKAAWKKEWCGIAIKERQRFEAAANVDWVNTSTGPLELRGDAPTFQLVNDLRMRRFVPTDAALASSQGGVIGAAYLYAFPCSLAVVVEEIDVLSKASFQQELPLLDRHAVIWAYWLQVYHAVTVLKGDEKTSNLHQLYTAGMSVTVEVRVGLSLSDAAVWSGDRSETFASLDAPSTHPPPPPRHLFETYMSPREEARWYDRGIPDRLLGDSSSHAGRTPTRKNQKKIIANHDS